MAGCGQADEQEKNQTNDQSNEQLEEEYGELDDTEEMIEKAESYISLLAEGEYEEVVKYFDETMKAELTPDALEEIWETLLEQAGNFIDQEFDSTEQVDDGYQLVFINGLFEATDVTFTITFDEDGQIAGFFMK